MTALLAEVVRSGYVEGTHYGSVIALRSDGSVALALGSMDRPIFPRSSNKPLQVTGLLAAGWTGTPEQIAIACSSHDGEPAHLEVVRSILGDLELQTPPQRPISERAWLDIVRAGGGPTPLTMTCSGKHAAMLRTAAVNGWSTHDYLDVAHPMQRACLSSVEQLAGEHVAHVAVDGCGAPQHGLTLPALARAYGRLVTGPTTVVADAMRAHPWLVGGTGRDVTRLMEGIPGLVAKDGWEGVYAVALPDGAAVALKISDGAERARTPVLVAALRALGVQAPVLEELSTTPVHGGLHVVGEVRVAGALAEVSNGPS